MISLVILLLKRSGCEQRLVASTERHDVHQRGYHEAPIGMIFTMEWRC
ncbi:hypothetical protein EaACW_2557 [Erwinia amylovora ACW56400]|nr:hypothetical protein EaACW_2557 [Erwinia amylovora ACW56400]CCO83203.1 hypothetical protein BN433_2644 [Erwinia amylovora Ea266]